MRSYHKVLGRASYDPATHKTTPQWTVPESGGYEFALAPGDFAVQYDLNPLYTAGTKGAGQTIGIINDANVSLALVNSYRSLFGLPANPPNVIVDGNDPGIDGNNNPDGPNGDSIEAYLDVEQAGAVAPAATIDLVIAGDTALESGLYLAASHAVYSDVAPVLSMSFGYCESLNGAAANSFWNTLWEQAAAQGQTAMVSTGDSGSAGCDNDNTQQYAVDGQQVNGFASTPWNVAVGGTDFYYSSYNSGNTAINAQLDQYWGNPTANASDTPTTTLQTKIPEQPWNNSQFGLNLASEYTSEGTTTIAGGSGGASNCATGAGTTCAGYAKPAWQAGTGVPADGVRDLPDLSLFASSGINFSFYPICAYDGDCQPAAAGAVVQFTGVGGTSASSPAFAAIMALVNEKYGPQGQADYVLYPLAKQFPTAFNDVTVGTNSVPCNLQTVSNGTTTFAPDDCIAATPTYTVTDNTYGTSSEGQIGKGTTAEYNAGTGYDLASGLGTIDANNLVTNWNKVTFATSSVTLTPSQTTFAHGTAITVSGTVTPGTAGGTVALETTSGAPINSAPGAGLTTPFAVSSGAYSGSVDYLPGGTYDIYGSYSGDGTNGPITSAKTSITVTPEASTTGLDLLNSSGSAVSTTASLPYGTQLLLEAIPQGATSKGTSNSPTGTVSYLNGTASIGSATLSAAGQAELNYAPLPSATPYSITAKYSGDVSYNASTSSAATFTVIKDTPNIGLASGSSTSLVSGLTAITVLVENSADYYAYTSTPYNYSNSPLAPTGVVTITGLPSGTLTLPALSSEVDTTDYLVAGVATLAIPAETAGTYSVTISYPGDADYTANSFQESVTVSAATGIATTTTASIAAATSATVAPNLTFTVTGTTGAGLPTGKLSLYVSGNYLGYVSLPTTGSGDSVTETVSLSGGLAIGANQLIVQYSGSSVYATSYAIANTVNGGTPAFSLANSGSINVTAGNSGTSTISVTPLSGLTGSVALTCTVSPTTGTSVPTCSVVSPATLNGGATTATLMVTTTSTTTAGGYTVTVNGADGALTSSVTVPVNVTTTGTTPPTPTVTLGSGGGITIASAGGTGTSAISVTPGGGFTGSVALACAVTATASDTPTCTITSPVAISGTTAGSATLTVSTTAASAALALPRMRLLPMAGGIAAAALLFFLVPMKRRRISTLLGALVLIAVIGFSAGCGGGGSPTTGGGNPGTTAGTYTVTVSGTATGLTIAPITVTVTVQ